ncbi:hypothetical protein D3C75_463820 [compost metagenome]
MVLTFECRIFANFLVSEDLKNESDSTLNNGATIRNQDNADEDSERIYSIMGYQLMNLDVSEPVGPWRLYPSGHFLRKGTIGRSE